jgi:hypothetical protein
MRNRPRLPIPLLIRIRLHGFDAAGNWRDNTLHRCSTAAIVRNSAKLSANILYSGIQLLVRSIRIPHSLISSTHFVISICNPGISTSYSSRSIQPCILLRWAHHTVFITCKLIALFIGLSSFCRVFAKVCDRAWRLLFNFIFATYCEKQRQQKYGCSSGALNIHHVIFKWLADKCIKMQLKWVFNHVALKAS